MENHQECDPRKLIIIFYTKMLNIITIINHNIDCLKKVNKTDEAIALTPTPLKVMGNHQEGDPWMLIIIFYVKMLNILTIISHNIDCLKKVNALTPPPFKVMWNHQEGDPRMLIIIFTLKYWISLPVTTLIVLKK